MKNPAYDYSMLRGLIVQKYGTLTAFAQDMGLKMSLLSMRLCNRTYWTQPDIERACKLLDITNPWEYFFVRIVRKNLTR